MDALDTLLTSFYLALDWQPYTWFALLVLVNVMDALTTIKALQLGGRELNPLMQYAIQKVGVVPAALLLKGLMLAGIFSNLGLVILYLPLLVLGYSLVVLWNLKVIAGLKARRIQ